VRSTTASDCSPAKGEVFDRRVWRDAMAHRAGQRIDDLDALGCVDRRQQRPAVRERRRAEFHPLAPLQQPAGLDVPDAHRIVAEGLHAARSPTKAVRADRD
jgi:hypothetical protein